jgi:hypothetical protein
MRRVPWWRVAAAIALVISIGIAASAGRTIEAAIIAVLTFVPLVLLVLELAASRRDTTGDRRLRSQHAVGPEEAQENRRDREP